MGIWQKRGDPIAWNLCFGLDWPSYALLEMNCCSSTSDPANMPSHGFGQLTDVLPRIVSHECHTSFLNGTQFGFGIGHLPVSADVHCCSSDLLFASLKHLLSLQLIGQSPRNDHYSDELSVIQKPFIFLPPPPVISSYKVTMTGLLINQLIALFSAQGSSMPDASGKIAPIHKKLDRHGRTPPRVDASNCTSGRQQSD